MEPTASFASSTIGWRISSRSSCVSPMATCRRRSSSLSKLAGLPGLERISVSITVMFFTQAPKSPGADPTLLRNLLLRQAHHAGLRARHQQPIVGDGIAQRPEAVAVHAGDHPV